MSELRDRAGGRRRRRVARTARALTGLLVALALLVPDALPASASGSTTTSTSSTTSVPGSPGTAPASASTTAPTTAAKEKKTAVTGVPAVPVGGPPTTKPKKGAAPAPAPNPGPILTEVQEDLDRIAAIQQYRADTALVQFEEKQLTASEAAEATERQAAAAGESQAAAGKKAADAKMRALAIAAYIGVGYTTQTPVDEAGADLLDEKEMLLVVSQHIVDDDNDAKAALTRSVTTAAAAKQTYDRAASDVSRTQTALASARRQLQLAKQVATDQLSPTAAAAESASASLASTKTGSDPPAPTILGTPVLSAAEMAAWYTSTGHTANATVPISQLAADYQRWGQELGVRDDIAFAQSIVETGFFSFPSGGQLTARDNNFAGIGACDSCQTGWSFPTADTGVGAQLELLYEYATTAPLPASVKDVIGAAGIGGCCSTWIALAGKWASSTVYGISIMTIYQQMLAWAIPEREVEAGLAKPGSVAASRSAGG